MNLGYVRQNVQSLFSRRELIAVLIRKRLRERHVGSVLGIFWSFYSALLPLAAYMLVFFYIARIEVPGAEGAWGYLVFVFSGLVPWVFFTRTVTESVNTLTGNLDLLRQAIFPMEILSVVEVSESFLHLLLQSAVLMVIACVSFPALWYKVLLLPVACLLLYLFCLGLSWILSIVGFYLQDLKEVLTTVTQFLIYVTPVLYKRENVPAALWIVFQCNPMTHVIHVFRDIVYNPAVEHPESFAVFGLMTVGVFVAGYLAALTAKATIADLV